MEMPVNIETTEDVSAFVRYLIYHEELNFHPDTPFDDYLDLDGKLVYTSEQCTERESLLEKCFALVGDDVYSIGLAVASEFLGMNYPVFRYSDRM